MTDVEFIKVFEFEEFLPFVQFLTNKAVIQIGSGEGVIKVVNNIDIVNIDAGRGGD